MKAFLLLRQPYIGLLNRATQYDGKQRGKPFLVDRHSLLVWLVLVNSAGSHAAVQHHPWIPVSSEFEASRCRFSRDPTSNCTYLYSQMFRRPAFLAR